MIISLKNTRFSQYVTFTHPRNNFAASFYNTAGNKLEEEKLSQIYLTKSAVDQLNFMKLRWQNHNNNELRLPFPGTIFYYQKEWRTCQAHGTYLTSPRNINNENDRVRDLDIDFHPTVAFATYLARAVWFFHICIEILYAGYSLHGFTLRQYNKFLHGKFAN